MTGLFLTRDLKRQTALGREDPRRRKWHPTPGFLPGESHGQRSLVGHVHGVARARHEGATEQPTRSSQCSFHRRANLLKQRAFRGEGIAEHFGMVRYRLLYLKWITNRDLSFGTGNWPTHAPAWMGGGFGGERTRGYVWPSPFTETITTLLSAIPQCKMVLVFKNSKPLPRSLR